MSNKKGKKNIRTNSVYLVSYIDQSSDSDGLFPAYLVKASTKQMAINYVANIDQNSRNFLVASKMPIIEPDEDQCLTEEEDDSYDFCPGCKKELESNISDNTDSYDSDNTYSDNTDSNDTDSNNTDSEISDVLKDLEDIDSIIESDSKSDSLTDSEHIEDSDSESVNSDSEPVDSDSEPVNSDSEPVDSDSEPVNSDSELEDSDDA